MTRISRLLVKIYLTLLLSGCVFLSVDDINITPESLAQIKTIAVIKPSEIRGYNFKNMGTASGDQYPGSYGGLANEPRFVTEQKITYALDKQKLSIESTLAENVAANLSKLGFVTSMEEGPWKLEKLLFSDKNRPFQSYKINYENIQSDADAVMIISPTVAGFIAPESYADYAPTIYTVVILLDETRQNLLYRGYHGSGEVPVGRGWNISPPSVTFASFKEVIANPDRAATSLNDAAIAIAESIARDFTY